MYSLRNVDLHYEKSLHSWFKKLKIDIRHLSHEKYIQD